MKTIVFYYSGKGNNKFLAEKISQGLDCEIEEIKPRINNFTFFLMGIDFGIKPIKNPLADYERVILVGPVWVGKFITPLKSFLKKYQAEINKLVFVTCCGSTEEQRFDKFGHGLVFMQVETILGDKCEFCQSFPIDMVMPEDHKTEDIIKTRLNESNFKGKIVERFDDFMRRLVSN